MEASSSGHSDVVHALLSGGAQVDLQFNVSTVYLSVCYRTKSHP